MIAPVGHGLVAVLIVILAVFGHRRAAWPAVCSPIGA